MRLAVTALLNRLTVHRWKFDAILRNIDISPATPEITMTNDDRLSRIEDPMIDTRLAVSALLDTMTQHQQNFERMVAEVRDIRSDMRDVYIEIRDVKVEIRGIQVEIRDMKAEIRGLQVENHRILEILEQRLGD